MNMIRKGSKDLTLHGGLGMLIADKAGRGEAPEGGLDYGTVRKIECSRIKEVPGMAIVRWTPARELLTLRDQMDRLVDDFFTPSWGSRGTWEGTVASFPMDIHQTDKEYVVKATLPGVDVDDLDVSIVGETLTIKAATQQNQDVKDEAWLLRETRYSAFSRSVTLPSEVQADKVDASYEGGILTLRIPKAEAVQPKAIKVKAIGK